MRDERGAVIFFSLALRPDTARPLGRPEVACSELRRRKSLLVDAERPAAPLQFTATTGALF